MISKSSIINLHSADFEKKAVEIFEYQAQKNLVYKQYLYLLKVDPKKVRSISQIPFLPIELFKSRPVISGTEPTQIIFSSSGTTGSTTSQHHVIDPGFYLKVARQGFASFYGSLEDYCVLALLPAYLERRGSSLVYMVDDFIRRSKYSESGFYLNNLETLSKQLVVNQSKNIPTLLIGVSFALLDLAEQFPQDLSKVILMETGGMKGRRKEITRDEFHAQLKEAFNLPNVHSEYGMTELLSQAYSKGGGWFKGSPTFRVLAREITDPFAYVPTDRTGLLNIVDLANVDSCSFLATDDLGQIRPDGSFKVIGRLDASDIRGCNLMINDRIQRKKDKID